MSDSKQPGSGKIIRTSSGSTRLTAGSSKADEKSADATGSGSNKRSGSGTKQGSGSGSGSSGPNSQNATVVAPPAPKPNRAPSAGSTPSAQTGSQGTGAAASGSQGSGAQTGSQGSGSQGTGGGNRSATSVMGNAANTVRASSGGVKMGVKNMVDSGQGKKKKGPRTVRLTVSAVDPWSVMKMSFLMSVAIGIATIVAFIVLWVVLQATGVMSGLESTMSELAGAESAERIIGIFGFGRVVAAGFIIAVINIVLMTALSTLAAFIYNIGSLIAGGFSLTLTDD
ncbi:MULTISPECIES: DUF3566 domain-containing protein [unclassified Brevibacterium]|uniref:DUF3566 domain-containing protein n=1 Tax=unclassified Brevibacterium TaxID=2614124 RepID=UPI001F0F6344|nr:DUF3566 domain-containing protein [Brevibacterium sp. S22]